MVYFFLSMSRPTIAIAIMIAMTPSARYIARVFVLTFDAVDVFVGTGVGVGVMVGVAGWCCCNYYDCCGCREAV